MATCSSLRSLFNNPLPENLTLIESLSSWNHHKPMKPIEVSSAEIFGEFYFQEKPESPAIISPIHTPPPLAAPALAQAPQSNISESVTKNAEAPENLSLDSFMVCPRIITDATQRAMAASLPRILSPCSCALRGLGQKAVDNLMDNGLLELHFVHPDEDIARGEGREEEDDDDGEQGEKGENINQRTCSMVEHGEIKAPVHGRRGFARLMTSVKISLDMMHRQCPRVRHDHSGYGGGYDPLAGHRREDITCKVSDSPFTNLTPEVTSTTNPCSLDDFLVAEMFTNERL